MENINIGNAPFDPGADNLRDAFKKVNINFDLLSSIGSTGFRGSINLLSPAPSDKGYFIPSEDGIYANFGSIEVDLTYGYTVIIYDGTNFEKQVVPVNEANGVITEGETRAVSGNNIFTYIPKETTSINIFDSDSINIGFYIDADGNLAPAADRYYSEKIFVDENVQYSKVYCDVAVYDSADQFLSRFGATTNNFVTPVNSSYLRVTSILFYLDMGMVVSGLNLPDQYVSGKKTISKALIPKPGAESFVDEDNLDVVSGKNTFKAVRESTNNLVPGTYSRNVNLFDKTTAILGSYIDTEGNIQPASGWWYSEKITSVPAGSVVIQEGSSVVEYNENDVLILRNAPSASIITLNSMTSYIRLTGGIASLDYTMIELGSVQSPYQAGYKRILKDQIADIYKEGNMIVVSKQGYFNTILKAVNYILYHGNASIDGPPNRWTILVLTGVYEEVVRIAGVQISLIGIDKYSCKIIDRSGQYENAPVNMGGGNLIKNFTVIASSENIGDYVGNKSYAVHHDYPGEGESLIEDCLLISKQSASVGIGLQNNQQLTIENSQMIGIGPEAGGLLMHPDVAFGSTKQKLTVKNSLIQSDSPKPLALIDSNNNGGGAGDNTDTKLTFYNNIVWSTTNGKTDLIYGTEPMAGGDYGKMKITGDSFGNNIPELNK